MNSKPLLSQLLRDAMAESGLSQAALARRLTATRHTKHASNDQALRRILNEGKHPRPDFLRDLARVFYPELQLSDDHFFAAYTSKREQDEDLAVAITAGISELHERLNLIESALSSEDAGGPGSSPRPTLSDPGHAKPTPREPGLPYPDISRALVDLAHATTAWGRSIEHLARLLTPRFQ